MPFDEPLPLLIVEEEPETAGMLAVLTDVCEVMHPQTWLDSGIDPASGNGGPRRRVVWVAKKQDLAAAAARARLVELDRSGIPYLLVTIDPATGLTWDQVTGIVTWVVDGP